MGRTVRETIRERGAPAVAARSLVDLAEQLYDTEPLQQPPATPSGYEIVLEHLFEAHRSRGWS